MAKVSSRMVRVFLIEVSGRYTHMQVAARNEPSLLDSLRRKVEDAIYAFSCIVQLFRLFEGDMRLS